MLKKLIIQNYALIEGLEVNFPNGLIIISGETGAGKSILLGALSLLLGKKADVSVIKDNSKNCVVEGEFENDGEELILRRVISPNGRSRCFINDEPVAINVLEEEASKIIDIHAQHQHLLLAKEDFQLNVLDYFSGAKDELKNYKTAYSNLLNIEDKLKKLNEKIASLDAEKEYKQFVLEKISEANLKEGELEELEDEQKILANSENIKNYLYSAINLLQPNGVSIIQNIKESINNLQKCSTFLTEINALINRLDECRIECKDIEEELESLLDKIVISPDRLAFVEDRLNTIYSLLRKHNVTKIEQLLSLKCNLEEELCNSEKNEEERCNLERKREEYKKNLEICGEKLSLKRLAAVAKLESVLQEKIRNLKMEHAIFKIAVEDAGKYGCLGKDKIEFRFSANGDEKLIQLQKVASGGELSRIMLCIKSLMAEYTGMPTMIFDEIDTGVSGSIADKMGELIGEMGKKTQIFAITHLPQIASKSGTHIVVYKEFDKNNNAKTFLKQIEGDDRINEVARMLSGSSLTEAAIKNAKELLKNKKI